MVSPFNFPLNLAAHKIAPAIAAGCPFVLKPASKTPIGALMIAEVLAGCADFPRGACSVITCDRKVGDMFVQDERLKVRAPSRRLCAFPCAVRPSRLTPRASRLVLRKGVQASSVCHAILNLSWTRFEKFLDRLGPALCAAFRRSKGTCGTSV